MGIVWNHVGTSTVQHRYNIPIAYCLVLKRYRIFGRGLQYYICNDCLTGHLKNVLGDN